MRIVRDLKMLKIVVITKHGFFTLSQNKHDNNLKHFFKHFLSRDIRYYLTS